MARYGKQGSEPEWADTQNGTEAASIVPVERIQSRILLIRGQKVILDSDLAELYGVPTKRLNEQIKRNPQRFPPDFVFALTEEEIARLRSQFATSKKGRGGRRYKPYVFTEHGVIMAASVLNTERAVQCAQVTAQIVNHQ